jgi:GT2 family glycosyltransferase
VVATRAERAAKPDLTVVIVSCNAAATVRECLESLRRQKTSRTFEVVLIDSSTDGTMELVRQHFPEVQLLHFSERKYCGDGRNLGVARAVSPLIAFLDADCVAADDWVERLCEAHEQPCVAVGGAIANREPKSVTAWAAYFCEFSRWIPGVPAQWMDDMAGANLSYKIKVLRAFMPFIEGTYCSDTELHWRLAAAGHAIRFEPTVKVYHTSLDKPLAYLRHEFLHGRSFARVRVAAGRISGFRRFAYAIGFPAVAGMLLFRIARRVLAAGGYCHPLFVSSPLVAAGVLSWSLGESTGYVGGRTR